MIPPHPSQLAEHRELVEDYLRVAIKFGWELGRMGLPLPKPEFDWSDGMPLIIPASVGE